MPSINVSPRRAHASRASALPHTPLWSVRLTPRTPRAATASISAATGRSPSEYAECRCRSIMDERRFILIWLKRLQGHDADGVFPSPPQFFPHSFFASRLVINQRAQWAKQNSRRPLIAQPHFINTLLPGHLGEATFLALARLAPLNQANPAIPCYNHS